MNLESVLHCTCFHLLEDQYEPPVSACPSIFQDAPNCGNTDILYYTSSNYSITIIYKKTLLLLYKSTTLHETSLSFHEWIFHRILSSPIFFDRSRETDSEIQNFKVRTLVLDPSSHEKEKKEKNKKTSVQLTEFRRGVRIHPEISRRKRRKKITDRAAVEVAARVDTRIAHTGE